MNYANPGGVCLLRTIFAREYSIADCDLRSRIGGLNAGEALNEGRLARPVRTHEGSNLSGAHCHGGVD
jgi:hypothetical protein